MTKAYEIAYANHNTAFAIFDAVRSNYRARKIGDAEFLTAKAIYDVATAEYDAAFAAEADAEEEIITEDIDDAAQLVLF